MKVHRIDTRVVIECTVAGYLVNFENDRKNGFDAECVKRILSDALRDSISEARREAYEQGFSDCKGRKKKRDYHSPFLGGV